MSAVRCEQPASLVNRNYVLVYEVERDKAYREVCRDACDAITWEVSSDELCTH